jgi:hypothetical protein
VREDRVEFAEGAFIASRQRFSYSQIEAVLMSPQNVLSFQANEQVFSARINPRKRKHQEAVAALVANVRRAHGLPA